MVWVVVIAVLGATGSSSAQTASEEDAPTVDEAEPAPQPERAKRPRLKLENVAPQKVYFGGSKPARFSYELAGTDSHDLVIEVVRKGGGEAVKRWTENDVAAGGTMTQAWGGKTRSGGIARGGTYLFRVRERGGELAVRSKADGDRSFGYFDHVFPIRGRHTYGDGIGAPRSGHRHQGQDLFASCGTPLEAARAGKVQFRGFQGSGAGHYLVIDGRKTPRDYVYMHLAGKASIGNGDRVRTGQRIGAVGESGNASGCHLHFELWSKPGWYEGGHFLNPTKRLRKWDRWS